MSMNPKDQLMDELILLRKKVIDLERDNRLFIETGKKLSAANQQLDLSVQQLKSKQETLIRTQKIAHVGSWDWDVSTDIVSWSDELFQIFRLNPENGAVPYADHAKIYTSESMQLLDAAVRNTLETGEAYEIDLEIIRGDETSAFCNARGFAKKDEKGKVIQLYGSFQDITERKNFEELLKDLIQQAKANEQQLRAANQQLQASEQQLRAAVQQLQANEQQLRASNQQLEASEQQLKEANKKIKESEKQFRQLFENMEQGFAVHEMIYDENNNPIDYRFFLINDSFEKLTGIVASDYIGKTVKQVLPEIDQLWIDNYGNVAKTGKPIQFEHYSKDFDKYYNVIAYSPKKDFFATVFTDTTQDILLRNQIIEAKEQLEKDTERYLGLINNLDSGIVIHAADTSILSNNQRAAELLGLSEDQLKGKVAIDPQWKFIYEDSSHMPINDYPVMRISTSKKPIKNQVLGVVRKSDDIVWLMVNGIPIIDNNNEISEIIISFIDITPRKQTETKLIKAKELAERNEIELKKVQEITHVGSWYLDIATNEVVWSKELYRMYGFDPDLPVPPYSEHQKLFAPESWEILSTSLAKTSEKGIPYELELRTVRDDGSNGWMWVRGEALYNENKKIVGLWGAAQDISERKKLEVDLSNSKDLLNETGRMAKVGGWEIDLFGNTLAWTEETFHIHELLPESQPDVAGAINYYHPDDQKMVASSVEKTIKTGLPFDFEARLITAKGNHVWVRASGKTVSQKGEIAGIRGSIQDITERKQSEIELIKAKEKAEESEKRIRLAEEILKNTFNISPSIISKANLNKGFFIEANQAVTRILGYSVEEFLATPIMELIHPDDIPRTENEVSEQLEGKEVNFFENRYLCKDGTYNWMAWHGTKADKDGIVTAIGNDINERKQAEENLIKSEKDFQLLAESMPQIVWVTDTDGLNIYFNQQWVDYTGLSLEESHGAGWITPFHPDDKKRARDAWHNAVTNNDNYSVECRLRRKDGDYFWWLIRGIPISDKDGNIVKWFGTCTDIQNIKKTEAELKFAKEKAEEADRLKSAFLANMSHEIRTPMNGILGFAELLKEPDLNGEQQQEYIRIIEKGGARMLNIINDIIDISKIESGQMKISVSETNVNEQMVFLHKFFQTEAENKGLKLISTTTKPYKDAILFTDREKLYAILTNLIKNAIKYTDKGTIEFGVSTSSTNEAVSEPVELLFFVKDTGIGISKDKQSSIFERFIQADSTDKHAYQGAGLGLAISKAFVEMLGGKIWVESTEGIGSTFYFTLPCNSITEENDEVEKVKSAQYETNKIKDLKILIAEDDEASGMLVEISVKRFAKEILIVRNGFEAVDVCRNNPDLDLILMDIQMPQMNGHEATREIREFNKEVVIIAQTAYALSGDKEKAIDAGCTDYLSKPIKRDKLEEMIEKYF